MPEISEDAYERLRQILVAEIRKVYTPEDAKDIGDGLLDFFDLLLALDASEGEVDDNDTTGSR